MARERLEDPGQRLRGQPRTAVRDAHAQAVGINFGAQTWVRAITKPVAGTVRVALGMVEQMSGWTVDTTTGVVTFTTAPAGGVIVRAGFEFDVPVRFDSDTLDVTLDFERLGSITSIPLLEIRR